MTQITLKNSAPALVIAAGFASIIGISEAGLRIKRQHATPTEAAIIDFNGSCDAARIDRRPDGRVDVTAAACTPR